MENKNWSRRRFTKAVISAQALIASGVLALPLSCKEESKSESSGSSNASGLTTAEQKTLELAMALVIPAQGKMPSAAEAGGLDYVLNILEELPDLGPLFLGLVEKMEAYAKETGAESFSALGEDGQYQVLERIEQNDAELFKVLKDFSYESYYTNPEIYSLIGYAPYPTGSAGPKMEPFDERLLDRMKTLDPLYTKI